jgi:sugar phosphate isomerase/epimerase
MLDAYRRIPPEFMSKAFPKLHNAMWPGLVGKGSASEPFIDLDTMLDLTAKAEVDGKRFDGVDLFLADPYISIDLDSEGVHRLAEKLNSKGFVAGSVVAPVWAPTGGGSAIGDKDERQRFLGQLRKACRIARDLRQADVRPYGIVRIDSAVDPGAWAADPEAAKKIAATFREACSIAEDHGERLGAEGGIWYGGMHSWRRMVELLETVGRPEVLGFQSDMANTLLYALGHNAPEDALLPPNYDWKSEKPLIQALRKMTHALRPWTIDFHVAQSDATVQDGGSQVKAGRHCLPDDPNGKLKIPHDAGYWLRDDDGAVTKAFQHICWDGCSFSSEVMLNQDLWNRVLAAMLSVRRSHGWA